MTQTPPSGAVALFNGKDLNNWTTRIQDHGNDVKYRNIWLVLLPLKGSDKY